MSTSKYFIKKEILRHKNVPVNTFSHNLAASKNFINQAAGNMNMTIKRIKGKKSSYLYFNNKKIGYMKGLSPFTTGKIASQICNDKFRLENYLRKLDIPVLSSRLFYEKKKAKQFIADNNSTTYVLKPLSLAGGDGIELNIDKHNFSDAWNHSIETQIQKNVPNPSCLVQPYINGFDVRISIVEGNFISALLRLPAHVIGDGENTINHLIDEKNSMRSKNPYFKNKLITIDQKLDNYLLNQNLTLSSIPNNEAVIILNDISNLTLGGESIDITNQISDEIKNTAINAVASIPQLYSAGVDLMSEDYQNGDGTIIEINTNANHTMHHLPYKGDVTHPFDTLMESLLIKYKVSNGIKLSDSETLTYKNIVKFNNLKLKMTTNIFNLTNI